MNQNYWLNTVAPQCGRGSMLIGYLPFDVAQGDGGPP